MRFLKQKILEVDFSPIKTEFYWWLGWGIFLCGAGRLLDGYVFGILQGSWRDPLLDRVIIFLTERFIWVILGVFAVVTAVRIWKNPDHKSKLISAIFSIVSAGILAFILKSFFHVPRPFEYEQLGLVPLVHAGSYSFPSAHTAVAFALLIPFYRISRTIGILWAIFALLIGFSRVYENVHFPSDIAGGIFLGGLVGAFFSHPESRKMVDLLWQEMEFRRQIFHFSFGFSCVFMHWAGFLRLWQIGALLIIGLFLSYISQFHKISLLSLLMEKFDRPRDKKFPGRGAFFFLLGVFLCLLIFNGESLKIAYAAILILSVGDSLNHLFGAKLQRIRFPWNKRKNIVGVSIGILSGTFAAQFFVPLLPAFIASTIAICLETVPFRIGKFYIDDNVMVPLVAGGLLWLLV